MAALKVNEYEGDHTILHETPFCFSAAGKIEYFQAVLDILKVSPVFPDCIEIALIPNGIRASFALWKGQDTLRKIKSFEWSLRQLPTTSSDQIKKADG